MLATWMVALAGAAVLDVGAGQPYATVNDALAGAADGDLILVHDTVVSEAIVVDGLQVAIRAATRATWEQSADATDVWLENGASVVLTNFDFVGDGSDYGAGVDGSALLLRSSTFTGFLHAVAGSGASASSVRAVRSTFAANTDTAISFYVPDGTVVVESSVFVDNGVGSNSAAIDAYHPDGVVTVVNRSLFARNGGAMGSALHCDTCTITDSAFVANVTDGTAVIHNHGPHGPMLLERNLFCGNQSDFATIYALGGTTTLRNNAFLENRGDAYGALMSDDAVLEHNTFLGNRSDLGLAVLEYGIDGPTLVGNLVAGTIRTGASTLEPAFYSAYAPMTSTYGAWFDNDGGHANTALGPTDLVDVDPMLSGAGPRCSWERIRPLPGSPLIDGDPTLLDADGSPADIGATGGPAAP